MTIASRSVLAAISLLGMACAAQATLLGLTDPLGAPSSGSVGYATWDTFVDADTVSNSAISILPASPTSSNTDVFSANLSGSMGGSVTGSGDRIYNGTGATSAAFNLTISGTILVNINTITLQIKLTPPSGYTQTNFFNVSLNSTAGSAVLTDDGTGEIVNGGEMGVITYTWTNLDLQADSAFNIVITSPAAGHASVDAFRLDASTSAVPEPSTYAMLLAGVGIVLWVKRRRFARQTVA